MTNNKEMFSHPLGEFSFRVLGVKGLKKNSDMKLRLNRMCLPVCREAEERALIIIIYELKILFSLFNIYLKPLKSKKFLQE